jgi:hypothetical protein
MRLRLGAAGVALGLLIGAGVGLLAKGLRGSGSASSAAQTVPTAVPARATIFATPSLESISLPGMRRAVRHTATSTAASSASTNATSPIQTAPSTPVVSQPTKSAGTLSQSSQPSKKSSAEPLHQSSGGGA